MKKPKVKTDLYPVKGSLLEKLQFIEKNVFKRMWKTKEMRRELLKRNDEYAEDLPFCLSCAAGVVVLMIQFELTVSQSFFTTNYKWCKEKNKVDVIVNVPPHKHFLKLISLGKKYIFPIPIEAKGEDDDDFDIDGTCYFSLGEGESY